MDRAESFYRNQLGWGAGLVARIHGGCKGKDRERGVRRYGAVLRRNAGLRVCRFMYRLEETPVHIRQRFGQDNEPTRGLG